MHDGTLHAHSDGLGEGSRFEIRFPRRTELPGTTELPTAKLPHGPQEGTRRVLIVDDNRDAANALAKLLSIRGFEHSVAYDGRTALEVVSRTSPDVVFLDIGLPDMTGYQVATELADHVWRKRLTLVALTGWGAREDLERSVEAGFDHHMTKPVSARKVLDMLAEIAIVRGLVESNPSS